MHTSNLSMFQISICDSPSSFCWIPSVYHCSGHCYSARKESRCCSCFLHLFPKS